MPLTAVVAALVALVAPAVAHADAAKWYTTDSFGGPDIPAGTSTEDSDKVVFEGALTAKIGASVTLGFCSVISEIDFWNTENEGTAEVTSFTIKTPCPAEIASVKCTIGMANAANLPGHVDVTGDEVISFTAVKITYQLNEPCPVAAASTSGTLTGVFNNKTHCFEFLEDGDMKTPTGVAVSVTGFLCDKGELLTLHT